ncbi:DUF3025 domain-containing protein [Luteibacter yeojuensis]
MRHVAPTRDALDRRVLASPPLSHWSPFARYIEDEAWPRVDALNTLWPTASGFRFATQDPGLLADGLHYEERIASLGVIATRPDNWHDLFNAFVWLRYGGLKRALNARQMAEIEVMGPRQRSRPQCALTHFDEAGLIVALRDPAMLDAWDAHDWHGLFWTHREAWLSGEARVEVFGHALLEHALTPGKLLVGKALVTMGEGDAAARCAEAIAAGVVLRDPQELRPLPVSGVPGWHPESGNEAFYTSAPCFQPLRPGRVYPPPLGLR